MASLRSSPVCSTCNDRGRAENWPAGGDTFFILASSDMLRRSASTRLFCVSVWHGAQVMDPNSETSWQLHIVQVNLERVTDPEQGLKIEVLVPMFELFLSSGTYL